ncbi:MAG: Fic family protein [Calditrichaeota bacterium]|nr:MAG: Fic family protein [Calditrichota bacterium]
MNSIEKNSFGNKNDNSESINDFETFYGIPQSLELNQLLEEVDSHRNQINSYPKDSELWKTIQEKLNISWTYSSNAIEGSTLTLGETIFFLQQGLTVEGKPFKDFLDAKNHSEAIELVFDFIKGNREISEGFIKEINALLLSGVSYTPALDQFGQKAKKKANPGQYKVQPNHVLQSDNTIHRYAEPLQVPTEMNYLVEWINKNFELLHPILLSSIAHYNFVRIHPFDDGNGRGARLLMNLILIKKGFQIAIIRNEERRKYLESLSKADKGNLAPFVEFVCSSLLQTQKIILQDLR